MDKARSRTSNDITAVAREQAQRVAGLDIAAGEEPRSMRPAFVEQVDPSSRQPEAPAEILFDAGGQTLYIAYGEPGLPAIQSQYSRVGTAVDAKRSSKAELPFRTKIGIRRAPQRRIEPGCL